MDGVSELPGGREIGWCENLIGVRETNGWCGRK